MIQERMKKETGRGLEYLPISKNYQPTIEKISLEKNLLHELEIEYGENIPIEIIERVRDPFFRLIIDSLGDDFINSSKTKALYSKALLVYNQLGNHESIDVKILNKIREKINSIKGE
jgi:hypothetical protein